jgi:hypothetical protein
MNNPPTPQRVRAAIPTSSPAPAGQLIADAEASELEALLEGLLREHEELLALAASHRDAISQADPQSLGACVQRQAEVARRVEELEHRRMAIVGRVAERMKKISGGKATEAVPDRLTISWIAKSLPEPVRARLVALADRLRELLARLQKEHAALREASLALAGHMEGLMRHLAKRLSHAGTYGRRGMVESRVQVVSALDLRS